MASDASTTASRTYVQIEAGLRAYDFDYDAGYGLFWNVFQLLNKIVHDKKLELIIVAVKVGIACGIKRLFGSIGKPPTKQSALLDNSKSEA